MENQPETNQPDVAKKKYGVKLLKKQVRFSLLQATAFVAVFALIGSFILIKSFAASPVAEVRGPILDSSPSAHASDELLVSFRPGASVAVQQALLNRYQAKVKQDIPQINTKLISVPEEAQDAVKEALSHNPAIAFVEYNVQAKPFETIPNDYWWPSESSQVTTQTNKAWDTTQGAQGTVVAILDTGVDPTQPDLQGAFVPGWNTLANTNDTSDIDGHGTLSAGVGLARSNNTIGVASYCWKCSLMPVKVMGSGTGSFSSVSSGITWAADHGAKVISMSLGFSSSSSTLQSAVTYAHNKGVVILAGAGNYGNTTPFYPASYAEVLGVAGTGADDTFYSWSNYGSSVKIAAPGCNFTTGRSGWYGTFCGTSSASPAAAGIVGLLRSYAPGLTNSQIEQALESNTDAIPNVYFDGSIGKNVTRSGTGVVYGRVNAYKAIQALGGVSTPPADTTAPLVSVTSPAGGTTVSGGLSVSVNASDNVAVAKVDLLIDGKAYASSATSPYSFYWNTTTAANGSHAITAMAYDAAGNVSSSSITVTVFNLADTVAPVVTITSPINGSIAGKKVAIAATATDNAKVTSMEVYIDGVLKTSSTTGSIAYSWAVNPKVAKGSHTIIVKAYDTAGNIGQSSVTVTK